jgi:hypothetical protein
MPLLFFFFIHKLLIKFNQPNQHVGIHHIYMYEIGEGPVVRRPISPTAQ